MDLLADITLPRRSFALRVELKLAAETVALVGPSGAGKTSLLKALAGLERPVAGRVILDGEVWMDAAAGVHFPPERRRVGYLPQDYALFPHLTVAGNVAFAARRERPDLLERLGVARLASARPEQLSGGERQRVALARALAREPRLLLLDEPFAALDAITRDQVRGELAALLPSLRLPTLLVTHSFEDAAVLASRIGVLDHGQIAQLGTADDLLREPRRGVVARLTGANTLSGQARPDSAGAVVTLDGGGELRSSTPASGAVEVAIQPWAIELTDPADGQLIDIVLNVRPERGGLVIRLSRVTVRLPAGRNGNLAPAPGARVGLRVAPEDVSLLAPNA